MDTNMITVIVFLCGAGFLGLITILCVLFKTNNRVNVVEIQLSEIVALLESYQFPSEGALPRQMKYVDGREDPVPV